MRTLLATIIVIVLVVIIAAGFMYAISSHNGSLATGNNASSTVYLGFATSTANSTSTSGGTSSNRTVSRNTNTKTPSAPATGGTGNSNTGTVNRNSPLVILYPTPSPSPSPSQTPAQNQNNGRYNFIYVSSANSGTLTVDPGTKNVAALQFTVQNQTGSDGLINQFIMGSDDGNAFYNYLENFRVMRSDGTFVATLNYTNQLLDWHPVFALSNPLSIPNNNTINYALVADLKPGVKSVVVPPLKIFGGSGNNMLSANATGNTIIVR